MIHVMLLTPETERGGYLGIRARNLFMFLLFLIKFGNCNKTISFI